MVDNFELIKSLLSFNSEDDFYHLQVIRRGKDHPELEAANRTIKTYYITKVDSLDRIKDEVITLCKLFGARAYINLGKRSFRKCTMMCISDMAKRAYDGDFKKIYKVWNTVVGAVRPVEPRWIIDLDDCTLLQVNLLIPFINSLKPLDIKDKIIATIPTKSGYHLITTSFDLLNFRNKYPDIDVHKNNPTILYVP